jgi:uncharacterized membrane protein YvbJ
MVKFCTSCGTANTPDARYCAKCGEAMPSLAPDVSTSQVSRPEPVVAPALAESAALPGPEPILPEEDEPKRNWLIIVAVIGSIILIGGLYYWLFLADDMRGATDTSYSTGVADGEKAEARQFFVMTEANIRDRATTVGSTILGKMPRGSAVTGVVKLGEDGSSEWLERSIWAKQSRRRSPDC